MSNLAMVQIARRLSISPSLVELVYSSYWKYIKTVISSLNLEEMDEEDFKRVSTNFNIPYIGKLFTSYEKVQKYKRKVKYLEENAKVKGSKTDVQSGVSD